MAGLSMLSIFALVVVVVAESGPRMVRAAVVLAASPLDRQHSRQALIR
jgi:hypothetical protein